MQEMVIDSIRVSLANYQRVVILKEKESDRYLPIWIGPAEADAIAIKLQGVSVPRPLTHDLLSSVIGAVGADLKYIAVSDLQNDTFYAKLGINMNDNTVEVDARPSDAIALAVREQVPIYVDETVLDKASVTLDESGTPIIEEEKEGAEAPQAVKEEDLKRMSAFTEFIKTLDLEDLGSSKEAES
mgnify:FL=1